MYHVKLGEGHAWFAQFAVSECGFTTSADVKRCHRTIMPGSRLQCFLSRSGRIDRPQGPMLLVHQQQRANFNIIVLYQSITKNVAFGNISTPARAAIARSEHWGVSYRQRLAQAVAQQKSSIPPTSAPARSFAAGVTSRRLTRGFRNRPASNVGNRFPSQSGITATWHRQRIR